MRDTEITAPDVTVFLDMIERLGRQRKDLAARLERAQAEARSRDADNLGEVKSLATLLGGAEGAERETLRVRIRTALRRLVRSAYVLVTSAGRDRVVALQVNFHAGDRHRDYVILIHPATSARPVEWEARSTVFRTGDAGHALDLRNPEHARQLEAALTASGPV
jgi:hypothetical protein